VAFVILSEAKESTKLIATIKLPLRRTLVLSVTLFNKMYRYKVYNYTHRQYSDFTFDNPFHGDFGEAFEKFLYYYSPDIIIPPPNKKIPLKKKSERMCRFCYGTYPAVQFKKEAHVMPQLMGNAYLTHDSECDACNIQFGLYEDSLSKFIGMMRTADRMKGQAGIPKFKSADGKFIMSVEKDENNNQFVSILDTTGNNHKPGEKSIILTAKKQSYIPLNVMKALYKIAYSVLLPSELADYASLRKIITSSQFDNKLSNFARIVKFTLPKGIDKPLVVTYKKKPEMCDINMPSKVIILHFGRYVYQYFLINMKDRFMFTEGEKCQWIYTPPFCDLKQEEIFGQMIDLSSPDLKKGEIDSITFNFESDPRSTVFNKIKNL
jgi:hypothetical protein